MAIEVSLGSAERRGCPTRAVHLQLNGDSVFSGLTPTEYQNSRSESGDHTCPVGAGHTHSSGTILQETKRGTETRVRAGAR